MKSAPVGSVLADVNVVQQTICNLQDEILGLKLKQKASHEQRRRSLNKILDIKGAIRVFCRIRPFLPKDGIQIRQPLSTVSEKIVVTSSGSEKEFGFDKVFTQQATQGDVFVEVEPILKSALDGSNVCVIAYGQTGSGKTFTMDGTNSQPGIVTRALKELFRQASMDSNHTFFTFTMSMLEVYMGSLRDLLAPKQSHKAFETLSRCNLNIQTDIKGLVEIENLTEVRIPDLMKANFWYAKGRRVRSTSWTNVNEASSRSHCLTRITIYRHGDGMQQKTVITKLWMIDLGGSERLLKTGATGQTLDEGRAINLSISALGDVIAALRRRRAHVPYRNSKLTQILKDSLGTGSKVLMLVHVSPCYDDVSETTCSLNFAKRANAIESNKELPMHLKKLREKRMSELQDEMAAADEECQKIQDQIQNAELLLSENKKLLSTTYGVVYDENKSPKSPYGDFGEISKSIDMSDKKIIKNCALPRFMTSTAASRQRQSYAEDVNVGRASTVKFRHMSSMQLPACQLASYSNPGFNAVLQNSNRRAQPVPQYKTITTSNPNFRGIISRHRRRMSNLI